MNTLFKLAYRNLVGAGLRTWLNVGALSFGFVMVVWMQGLYEGMLQQMTTLSVDGQYGGGQYWEQHYDPFDPLTLADAHATPGAQLQSLIDQGRATGVLQRAGTLYANGRARGVTLNGIDPDQQIISFPTQQLSASSKDLPVMMGERMAADAGVQVGDVMTLRWRDVNGTFDATDIEVVAVVKTQVPSMDGGQLWLRLDDLKNMLNAGNELTYIITEKGYGPSSINDPNFDFRSIEYLLEDETTIYESKKAGGAILYVILLSMGLLAVFDTQVLAIFRRRREIGTLMALGMNRGEVIGLFTIEGSMHGLLAIITGAVWGIPLMAYTSLQGIPFPADVIDSFGIALGAVLYTHYIPGVYLVTLAILMLSVVIISYLPTRQIARLKATDAIRGKQR